MTTPITFADALTEAGLSITSVFIPWPESRSVVLVKGQPSPRPTDWSLNWRVSLHREGRSEPILTTDYTAGIGHAPSYPTDVRETGARFSLLHTERLWAEVTTGRAYRKGAPILPSREDVCVSLFLDAGVLDYPDVESWARDAGYDEDSRKAEQMYQACRDTANRLLSALGAETLTRLRDLAQEY